MDNSTRPHKRSCRALSCCILMCIKLEDGEENPSNWVEAIIATSSLGRSGILERRGEDRSELQRSDLESYAPDFFSKDPGESTRGTSS
eukprot:759129-Hanusia_phi.AAC.3